MCSGPKSAMEEAEATVGTALQGVELLIRTGSQDPGPSDSTALASSGKKAPLWVTPYILGHPRPLRPSWTSSNQCLVPV